MKLSDFEDAINKKNENKGQKKSFIRKRSKSPAGPKTRQRSSSCSSDRSTLSYKSKKSDNESIKLMIKNSEMEFKNLEARIEGLQNLMRPNYN